MLIFQFFCYYNIQPCSWPETRLPHSTDKFSTQVPMCALGNSERLPVFWQWEKGNRVTADHQSLPQEEKDPS